MPAKYAGNIIYQRLVSWLVDDTELLKQKTSSTDLVYFDLPFVWPVLLDSLVLRPGPSMSYLHVVCHSVAVQNEFPRYNISSHLLHF